MPQSTISQTAGDQKLGDVIDSFITELKNRISPNGIDSKTYPPVFAALIPAFEREENGEVANALLLQCMTAQNLYILICLMISYQDDEAKQKVCDLLKFVFTRLPESVIASLNRPVDCYVDSQAYPFGVLFEKFHANKIFVLPLLEIAIDRLNSSQLVDLLLDKTIKSATSSTAVFTKKLIDEQNQTSPNLSLLKKSNKPLVSEDQKLPMAIDDRLKEIERHLLILKNRRKQASSLDLTSPEEFRDRLKQIQVLRYTDYNSFKPDFNDTSPSVIGFLLHECVYALDTSKLCQSKISLSSHGHEDVDLRREYDFDCQIHSVNIIRYEMLYGKPFDDKEDYIIGSCEIKLATLLNQILMKLSPEQLSYVSKEQIKIRSLRRFVVDAMLEIVSELDYPEDKHGKLARLVFDQVCLMIKKMPANDLFEQLVRYGEASQVGKLLDDHAEESVVRQVPALDITSSLLSRRNTWESFVSKLESDNKNVIPILLLICKKLSPKQLESLLEQKIKTIFIPRMPVLLFLLEKIYNNLILAGLDENDVFVYQIFDFIDILGKKKPQIKWPIATLLKLLSCNVLKKNPLYEVQLFTLCCFALEKTSPDELIDELKILQLEHKGMTPIGAIIKQLDFDSASLVPLLKLIGSRFTNKQMHSLMFSSVSARSVGNDSYFNASETFWKDRIKLYQTDYLSDVNRALKYRSLVNFLDNDYPLPVSYALATSELPDKLRSYKGETALHVLLEAIHPNSWVRYTGDAEEINRKMLEKASELITKPSPDVLTTVLQLPAEINHNNIVTPLMLMLNLVRADFKMGISFTQQVFETLPLHQLEILSPQMKINNEPFLSWCITELFHEPVLLNDRELEVFFDNIVKKLVQGSRPLSTSLLMEQFRWFFTLPLRNTKDHHLGDFWNAFACYPKKMTAVIKFIFFSQSQTNKESLPSKKIVLRNSLFARFLIADALEFAFISNRFFLTKRHDSCFAFYQMFNVLFESLSTEQLYDLLFKPLEVDGQRGIPLVKVILKLYLLWLNANDRQFFDQKFGDTFLFAVNSHLVEMSEEVGTPHITRLSNFMHGTLNMFALSLKEKAYSVVDAIAPSIRLLIDKLSNKQLSALFDNLKSIKMNTRVPVDKLLLAVIMRSAACDNFKQKNVVSEIMISMLLKIGYESSSSLISIIPEVGIAKTLRFYEKTKKSIKMDLLLSLMKNLHKDIKAPLELQNPVQYECVYVLFLLRNNSLAKNWLLRMYRSSTYTASIFYKEPECIAHAFQFFSHNSLSYKKVKGSTKLNLRRFLRLKPHVIFRKIFYLLEKHNENQFEGSSDGVIYDSQEVDIITSIKPHTLALLKRKIIHSFIINDFEEVLSLFNSLFNSAHVLNQLMSVHRGVHAPNDLTESMRELTYLFKGMYDDCKSHIIWKPDIENRIENVFKAPVVDKATVSQLHVILAHQLNTRPEDAAAPLPSTSSGYSLS